MVYISILATSTRNARAAQLIKQVVCALAIPNSSFAVRDGHAKSAGGVLHSFDKSRAIVPNTPILEEV